MIKNGSKWCIFLLFFTWNDRSNLTFVRKYAKIKKIFIKGIIMPGCSQESTGHY